MIKTLMEAELMNIRTYNDLIKCMVDNLYKIPRDIDLIVGIPRSGMMVANILALYMNLPCTDIDNFLRKGEFRTGDTKKCSGWIKSVSEAKRVLVVDDSVSTGTALKEAKRLLEKVDCEFVWLAAYIMPFNKSNVDIYFEVCNQPRMFEWNFMHHWGLQNSCMDIDGVLCQDPSFFENDDGNRYKAFIKNAPPKFIPTQKVGKLVTSRLEKYRSVTELWLKRYGIEYDELIMMDGISALERQLEGNHARFKAEIYKGCDAILFFESDYSQAIDIVKISGKPVFCIETMELINSEHYGERILSKSMEMKATIKHIIKKIIWIRNKRKEK